MARMCMSKIPLVILAVGLMGGASPRDSSAEPQTLGEEGEEVPRGNLRMEGVPPVSWIARPVRVQLVPGGSDQSVEGNLYTVDPVTGSLVLVRFRSEKPWQVSWIPREGYASVTMLEESSPHCQQYSVELADMMGSMFGMQQVNQVDDDELKERRERLLSWLRSNHVDVKECADGSLLIFGAARIQSPFTEDSCFCDNSIVLKRLRALVGKVPK